MSYGRRQLAGCTVHALCDGAGPFFQARGEAFPDASAETWAAADRYDPAAVDEDGQWVLHFHCYAIRFDGGSTVLVDAGIGRADAPSSGWAPVPGRLPEQLARAEIDPSTVETVVLTHLHTDHIGWAVDTLFPNARHVLQRADVEAVGRPLTERLIDPLRAADRLQVVDGDVTLRPGLQLRHTPGHTPGHQIVLLRAGDETLALTGDLLLHAVHLVDPAVTYLLDDDQAAARESRIAALAELATAAAPWPPRTPPNPSIRFPSGADRPYEEEEWPNTSASSAACSSPRAPCRRPPARSVSTIVST